MARVCLNEYFTLAVVGGTGYPAFKEPADVVQTAKTSLDSSVAFSATNAKTKGVRLTTDTAIHFRAGLAPTATQNDSMLGGNQGIDLFLPKGHTIAVLAQS